MMGMQYMICRWAINRSDPQNLLSITLDVPLHFPFISGLDVYVIETLADIKFCEVPGSVKLGDEFGDKEKIFVLDGYSVQHAIVLDQPE